MGIDMLDALGFNIATPDSSVLAVQGQEKLYHVAARFPELFQSKSGKVIQNFTHKPDKDTHVPPVVEPLRRIALIYQDKVTRALKAMEEDGVLEKIDSSPLVSNMVIVPKPNDEIRICGYLRNSNKAIISDRYPLPAMDELSQFFAGATVFSMIDLK